jgi:radical SAM protein with 4Fe4S-binding SPASM domain
LVRLEIPHDQSQLRLRKQAVDPHRRAKPGLAQIHQAVPGRRIMADHPIAAQDLSRQNLAELPRLWREARREGIHPYVEKMTVQGRARENRHLLVSREEMRRLYEELARIDREEFARHWEVRPPLAGATCNRHLYSCTVTTTGDVIPCPGVDLVLGNIKRTPLAAILAHSPVVRDLRDIYARIKGPCRSCKHNGRCYGCRGNAYQLTGDYLASDPSCWLNREAGAGEGK